MNWPFTHACTLGKRVSAAATTNIQTLRNTVEVARRRRSFDTGLSGRHTLTSGGLGARGWYRAPGSAPPIDARFLRTVREGWGESRDG